MSKLKIFGLSREETKRCKSGWTGWFNRDVPKDDGFRSDIENIPTLIELLEIEGSPACEKDRMVDIQCRTVDGQVSYKDVRFDLIYLTVVEK